MTQILNIVSVFACLMHIGEAQIKNLLFPTIAERAVLYHFIQIANTHILNTISESKQSIITKRPFIK